MNAQPEIFRIVTDMEALHEAVRDRVEDMNISRIEFDAHADLPSGYSGKLLSDPPKKFMGKKTLPKILKGTGLAIALIVDDGKLPADLPVRKYKIGRLRTAALSIDEKVQEIPISLEQLMKERMRELGRKGGKMGGSKGGKRRAETMKKRARQRAASHAARMRWAKKTEIAG